MATRVLFRIRSVQLATDGSPVSTSIGTNRILQKVSLHRSSWSRLGEQQCGRFKTDLNVGFRFGADGGAGTQRIRRADDHLVVFGEAAGDFHLGAEVAA
jgi:hypothetical protein